MPQLSLLEEIALYLKDKMDLFCPTCKRLTGDSFCHNSFCDCLSSHLKCSVYLKTKALINCLICFIFTSYIFHTIDIYRRLWKVEKKKKDWNYTVNIVWLRKPSCSTADCWQSPGVISPNTNHVNWSLRQLSRLTLSVSRRFKNIQLLEMFVVSSVTTENNYE